MGNSSTGSRSISENAPHSRVKLTRPFLVAAAKEDRAKEAYHTIQKFRMGDVPPGRRVLIEALQHAALANETFLAQTFILHFERYSAEMTSADLAAIYQAGIRGVHAQIKISLEIKDGEGQSKISRAAAQALAYIAICIYIQGADNKFNICAVRDKAEAVSMLSEVYSSALELSLRWLPVRRNASGVILRMDHTNTVVTDFLQVASWSRSENGRFKEKL